MAAGILPHKAVVAKSDSARQEALANLPRRHMLQVGSTAIACAMSAARNQDALVSVVRGHLTAVRTVLPRLRQVSAAVSAPVERRAALLEAGAAAASESALSVRAGPLSQDSIQARINDLVVRNDDLSSTELELLRSLSFAAAIQRRLRDSDTALAQLQGHLSQALQPISQCRELLEQASVLVGSALGSTGDRTQQLQHSNAALQSLHSTLLGIQALPSCSSAAGR